MTIGTIIAIIIIGLVGLGGAMLLCMCAYQVKSVIMCVVGVILAILTIGGCALLGWWNLNSASGRRAYKDQESNLNGGIERIVTVYDINGDIIETYKGKFDIETDRESYILFDDEQGLRHIIYYTTGTITVDEVS